jgi:predicted transposase
MTTDNESPVCIVSEVVEQESAPIKKTRKPRGKQVKKVSKEVQEEEETENQGENTEKKEKVKKASPEVMSLYETALDVSSKIMLTTNFETNEAKKDIQKMIDKLTALMEKAPVKAKAIRTPKAKKNE